MITSSKPHWFKMNRLAFLRLTQTCTTILDSIYKELEDADESTIQDLQGPIQVLERYIYFWFLDINTFRAD